MKLKEGLAVSGVQVNKMEDLIKGKNNRLKIGQKVELKQQYIDWNCNHLTWMFGKKPSEKEIGPYQTYRKTPSLQGGDIRYPHFSAAARDFS